MAKLRHLKNLTKLGKIINFARKGAAVVDIVSGATNALLKITSLADTELGNALSEYLFYLEMLSLSVDAGELATKWISKGLKKSARNILKHSDDLEKHLDDLVKNNELTKAQKNITLDELFDIAEQESKRIIKRFPLGGKFEVLSRNLLKKYIKDLTIQLNKKGFKLEINWINKNHTEFLSDLLGRTRVPVKGKKIILQIRQDCPKITWYHELYHFDDLLNLGQKEYIRISKETPWVHEYSVWQRILKNKNKWRKEELVDAYLYVKRYFKKYNQPFNENIDIEILGKKLKLIK